MSSKSCRRCDTCSDTSSATHFASLRAKRRRPWCGRPCQRCPGSLYEVVVQPLEAATSLSFESMMIVYSLPHGAGEIRQCDASESSPRDVHGRWHLREDWETIA